jgi:hypothetical protein
MPFVRIDWYPEISFNYAGRYSTDYLKMKGESWGIDLNYKYALDNSINLKAGLGYFRYSFNKLENYNSLFGNSNIRPIDYPSFNNLGYYTDAYFYNSLSLNIGAEKIFLS